MYVPFRSGKTPILGNRYKCNPVTHCRDYDLCETCFHEPSLAELRAHHGRFIRVADEIQSSAALVTKTSNLPQVVESLLRNYSPLPFLGQWVSASRGGRSVKFKSFGDVLQRAKSWHATVSRYAVQPTNSSSTFAATAASTAASTSTASPADSTMPKRPAVVICARNSIDWVVVDIASLLYALSSVCCPYV
jgi:hypothetical protein